MTQVNIKKMADLIKDHFNPLDIFKVNETAVKLVKIKGKYHWHKHNNQDELFIVVDGQLTINFEDGKVVLNEWEGYVVKRGLMHQSFAENEALILMIEHQETVDTGD